VFDAAHFLRHVHFYLNHICARSHRRIKHTHTPTVSNRTRRSIWIIIERERTPGAAAQKNYPLHGDGYSESAHSIEFQIAHDRFSSPLRFIDGNIYIYRRDASKNIKLQGIFKWIKRQMQKCRGRNRVRACANEPIKKQVAFAENHFFSRAPAANYIHGMPTALKWSHTINKVWLRKCALRTS
jgi:hypothetical protein